MGYEVRFCRTDEQGKLLHFLRRSWSSSHVFLSRPELLDWQYLQSDRYNFVVAYHRDSKEFHAVLGFIAPSFFSQARISSGDDLWLSIWKVEKLSGESASHGLEMLNFLRTRIPSQTLSAIGINSQVARVYRALGCNVSFMSHFYIPNYSIDEFQIAQGQHLRATPTGDDSGLGHLEENLSLEEIHSGEVLAVASRLGPTPRNRPEYIVTRFTNHPEYVYRFFLASHVGQPQGLLVVRKVIVEDSCCLRIVDFIGFEALGLSLKNAAQVLLKAEAAEYIDLVFAGLEHHRLRALGFVECDEESYVPHHFEPFEPERKQVQYAVFDKRDLVILKGDSDLDRPNNVLIT